MMLAATEFIRRLLLHVLPAGFQRIRNYRLPGHRRRAEQLAPVSPAAGHACDTGTPTLIRYQ
jgi:hypothetical protein